MRYTEYHNGVAVIKDKSLMKEAMAKLAKYEDKEDQMSILKNMSREGEGMTFKEWIAANEPGYIEKDSDGGVWCCPWVYGLEPKEESWKNCKKGCEYCWNREMPEEKKS